MLAKGFFFLLVVALQALEALVFIKGLKLPSRWSWPVIGLFVLFNLALPYLLWLQSGARQPPLWAAALIVRPVYAWHFNWLSFLLFIAPIIVLVRGGAWLAGSETAITALRWGVVGLTIFGAVLSVYGLIDTLRPPELIELEVEMRDLPADEDGLRVAVLSDPHIGWWNAKEEFQEVARMIADMEPDLLLVVGDMVDHHPDYVHVFADCLEGVRPRLGRYAIIGNHDVYTGREAVARRMEARGFDMIRNGWKSLDALGSSLVLAGMDDSGLGWTGEDPATSRLPKVLAGCPENAPVILMKHRPSSFEYFEGLPVDLVLSGHTHGGQLKLPFGGPGLADLTYEFTEGLHQKGGQAIYVSKGTGTVGWPFRLFCPREVTLITLRSPRAGL